MGEIKSTMDLVMEKTKHLSMTEEEKINQKQADAEKKIKGLVQKFQDKIMNIHELDNEYKALKGFFGITHNHILIQEIIKNIDLSKENSELFILLKNICKMDVAGLTALLKEYQTTVTNESEKMRKKFLHILAEKHSIEGSGVLPNFEADPEWREIVNRLRSEYQSKLQDMIQTK